MKLVLDVEFKHVALFGTPSSSRSRLLRPLPWTCMVWWASAKPMIPLCQHMTHTEYATFQSACRCLGRTFVVSITAAKASALHLHGVKGPRQAKDATMSAYNAHGIRDI